jgi:hypothetical protein
MSYETSEAHLGTILGFVTDPRLPQAYKNASGSLATLAPSVEAVGMWIAFRRHRSFNPAISSPYPRP